MPLVLSRLVPALILGLFAYVAYLVMTTHHVPEAPIQSLATWQRADVPFGIPLDVKEPDVTQQFNPRMQLHSPFEAALLPTAPRFDSPMGSEHAALTYNAQGFMEMNKAFGGKHTGDDLNGIGGKNTDYGDPVYAVANGLVIYTGTPSAGWGKAVILAHRLLDGRLVHSMYAHLHQIDVPLNSYVGRGAQIGSVGSANGTYYAHLHLEMRHTDGFSPQAGYRSHPLDRLAPTATIKALRNAPATALNPGALEILQNSALKHKTSPSMDTESAIQFQEFLHRKAE